MEASSDFYEMDRTPRGTNLNWTPRSKFLGEPIRRTKKRGHNADITDYQKATPKLNVCETPAEPFPVKFKRLLTEWREQATFLPSVTAMVMLPSYQEIVGMGKPALPLILNELKEKPSHLFWALRAISGVDPVPPKDRGRVGKMVEAWIKWGRQNKIIE